MSNRHDHVLDRLLGYFDSPVSDKQDAHSQVDKGATPVSIDAKKPGCVSGDMAEVKLKALAEGTLEQTCSHNQKHTKKGTICPDVMMRLTEYVIEYEQSRRQWHKTSISHVMLDNDWEDEQEQLEANGTELNQALQLKNEIAREKLKRQKEKKKRRRCRRRERQQGRE
jgi:hypothetical protein